MSLKPFQDRVIAEKAALDANTAKLSAFLTSEHFDTLDPLDQILLCRQEFAMLIYAEVPRQRIERFSN